MGKIAKGLLAGAAGTAAMTLSSTLEQKLRGREGSTAPADAAATVLGIDHFPSEEAKNRFSEAVHWVYGTSWGAVRALLGAFLPPAAASATHLAMLWGSEQLMLPALDVSPPLTEWGAVEVAIDAGHHVVYAAATGATYELLNS
ncbi:MAG TPA: hypothetical protein VF032_20265 [Thermoleophilaceae bacterium]